MDNIVREVLKTKLRSLKGTCFQDAIDRIFMTIYGEQFLRVKQKRDKGSDGILNGNNIIAVYAPESYSLVDFKKKSKGDYDSYSSNWSDTHPEWSVVTNLETTASMIQYVDSLKSGSKIICVEQLLELVSKQTWTKRLAIFSALDIPDRYLTNDLFSTVVEDLIKSCDDKADFQPYERPIYMETKISLNVSEENIDTFSNEYEECLSVFPMLQDVISSHSSGNISSIRSKIRNVYIGLSGGFEKKINSMVEILSKEKIDDDYYTYHMRVVLLYFFEQCLFGIKAPEESLL